MFLIDRWIIDMKHILKPISNRSLFKLIISDQTLIKLKWIFAYILDQKRNAAVYEKC